ncbi:Histone-lysine N-methyltransferase SETMAR [Melipona quadrifasciata]|uniref:Histone-lysine N-methyltransferase SETMAR n=1 Tax=Melipona quadrifasciata TaxID=166423 RepID=A0A0M9A1B3_9HYME|nr:Histone-lysine N-methyltransferase SETMAR [Melipona quadrifasciata]
MALPASNKSIHFSNLDYVYKKMDIVLEQSLLIKLKFLNSRSSSQSCELPSGQMCHGHRNFIYLCVCNVFLKKILGCPENSCRFLVGGVRTGLNISERLKTNDTPVFHLGPTITKHSGSTPDLLPALLLIHGDSYSWGAGNSFDGTALAAYGRLIVVSINFRLGVLELANRRGVFHHDNARPHVALAVRQELLQFDWDVLPHPPYSPDLAPSDYYLFLSLKNSFREFNAEYE